MTAPRATLPQSPAPAEAPLRDAAPASAASPMSFSSLVGDDAVRVDEVILAAYDSVLFAELVRGRLEASDIKSRLLDHHTVSMAAHLAQAVGGVKVVVAKSDEARARDVLAAPAFVDDNSDDDAVAAVVDPVSAGDVSARRALGWAAVGLVVPVLGQVVSLVYAKQAHDEKATLTSTGRRQYGLAVAVDVVFAGLCAAAVFLT